MLTVNIRERDGGERRLVFGTEEVTIGRAKGSDILLPRNNISKRHARLVDRDDKVVLVDLRSTNGTYVNGRRITAPEVISPKDKIYIGDFVMKVESVKSPQHEHTMPQAPISETAMMDPAPLEASEDEPAMEAEGAIEMSDLVPDEGIEIEELEQGIGPSTDPGLAGAALGENKHEGDEEEAEEATAALDLDDLGLSADEAEVVGLAPTRHRGMEEENASKEEQAADEDESESADPSPAEAAPTQASEEDEGFAFDDFEIDIEGDEGFEALDPADDPPTRQAAPPEPLPEAAPEEAEPAPDEAAAAPDEAEASPDEAEASDEDASEEGESMSPEQASESEPDDDMDFELDVEGPSLTADAIDAMLGDVTVDEILINGTESVAVRRGMVATVIPGSFAERSELESVVISLAQRAGVDVSDEHIVKGELAGDVSLHIIQGPLAPNGPIVRLSRSTSKTLSASDLVDEGTLTEPLREALQSAVNERKNIVIVSNRHGGRSTMLNALAHFAPKEARMALIEHKGELSVPQRNSVRLDKDAIMEAGESLLDLVPQLDADHVLIDPISAEDVVEFVGLALGGHEGLMITFRGRSANTVLRRMSLALELSVGAALGERSKDMIAEAVDLIVVVDQAEDGMVVREVVTVDDAGPSGFRTSEILAYS